jgi:hypothetical protein
MPRCKHRKRNTFPKWQFLPVGRIYPAKFAAFRAILAMPFAKRGECASCENAQHLSCQHSHKVIPRKLSARLTHCLFLRANRPAIALQISPLCYPLPHGKRNPTPFSRDVSTIHLADYIMLLCSTTQHQPLTQTHPIAQGKTTAIVATGYGYGYRMTERGAWHGLTPAAAGQDGGRSGGVAAAGPRHPW